MSTEIASWELKEEKQCDGLGQRNSSKRLCRRLRATHLRPGHGLCCGDRHAEAVAVAEESRLELGEGLSVSAYGRLEAERRKGSEPIHDGGRALGYDLLGFWRWSVSDLVSNATRGRLAEYLVAIALGCAEGVRDEWAAVDLVDPQGVTVEVKSAAYIQSWHQDRPSRIMFRYPKTRAWDPDTNRQAAVATRQAQVYVFALLAHRDPDTLDPLDVSQWEFYVVPTATLDQRKRSQHSITLKSLRTLHGDPVPFRHLQAAVARAAAAHRAASGSHSE